MSNSPQFTEVKRPRLKAQLFKWFDRKPLQRKSFDEDVTRLEFANWIASHTLSAIAESKNIKEIFVIKIAEGNTLAEHICADEEHAQSFGRLRRETPDAIHFPTSPLTGNLC